MRILFVEDDKDLCQALLIHFKSQGYDTDICNNGTDGLFYALQNVYDLMILDRMLPELDGLTLLNTIRKRGIQTPVILATAMDTLDDKIHGLDEGADDYITKPFGNQEMLARIRTALRHRRQPMESSTGVPVYKAGDLKIDFDKRRVFLAGKEIRLTQIEYKLVTLLAQNSGKVLTYDYIISHIWGPYADNNNQILRVNMAHIRRKLEVNPAEPKYIFTEIGVGYRMQESQS